MACGDKSAGAGPDDSDTFPVTWGSMVERHLWSEDDQTFVDSLTRGGETGESRT